MKLDAALLDILACPQCKSPLRVDEPGAGGDEELVCTSPSCRLAYPVRDDIPVLLVDEARRRDAGPDEAPAEAPDEGADEGAT